jgi:tubulin alpha
VTGCSGGIGLGLVKALAARGDKVYATVRKRETTATGEDLISKVAGDVTVIEGIDVTSDDVGSKLTSALAAVKIDVVVHNAGGIANRDGPGAPTGMDAFADGGGGPTGAKVDNLKNVTMERMLAAFQVNTLGPLRVQQALTDLMGEGGKVLIISSGMGSITDNGSGGLYAYRTAKAAVNMVMRNMSLDLKSSGIAVMSVNPGMVLTDFGPGAEMMGKFGSMPVEDSVAQLLTIFDSVCTMENTGKFWSVKKGAEPIEFAGGF